MLWLWDATWPELIHPFASAIDTDLPVVPEEVEMVCVMGGSKKAWVRWPGMFCFSFCIAVTVLQPQFAIFFVGNVKEKRRT